MVRERFGDTSCCFVLSGVALVQLRLGIYAQMLIIKGLVVICISKVTDY
jgi:hypothetical protein